MSEEQRVEIYGIISDELRTVEEEIPIRLILGAFDGDIWPHLNETARLRIENRLIRSIRDGRYRQRDDRCIGGAFGTWGQRYLQYFILKEEVLNTLCSKLRSSNVEEEKYVLKYFFSSLDRLASTIPPQLDRILIAKLKAGNTEFRDALDWGPWADDVWSVELREAHKAFEEKSKPDDSLDEDIPFRS